MIDELPDIQNTEPLIKLPIQECGVQNVEVPFKLESRDGQCYNDMVAKVSMRAYVPKNIKGVSMSRFILTLKDYLNKPLKHKLINEILMDLRRNINSSKSYLKFEFKLPVVKKSPISKNEFPIYYNCMFEAQSFPILKFKFFQCVTVQYSSYCPCSAELSKDLIGKGFDMGFPHAQRSFAKILIQTIDPNIVWLEDIIDIVENSVKTLPYPIIKRIDEQEISKIASQNPIFVEDACRLISIGLNNNESIYDWIIKCTHQESIHTSDAIAINWKGIKGGFDGRYYL